MAATGRMVLVTRPEAEARETAERLERLGWRPVLAPAMRIAQRALHVDPAWRPQAILIASGNALPAIPRPMRGIRLLTVGDATASRARAAGFADVASAGGDAAALAVMTARSCDPSGGPLLLACGAGQGRALLAELRERGFRVLRRTAYAARPLRDLPEPARAALGRGEVAAALFFSAASAAAFSAALRRADAVETVRPVIAAAISRLTAETLALLPWRDIRVASRPNQDELLECLS